MPVIGINEIILISTFCVGACLVSIWVLYFYARMDKKAPFQKVETVSFLFEEEHLLDASMSAYGLLGTSKAEQSYWDRLRDVMLPRFPQFPSFVDMDTPTGKIITTSHSDTDHGQLVTEWWDNRVRIELIEGKQKIPLDQHNALSAQQDLRTLQNAVHGTPYPVWQTNAEGEPTWTNAAYDRLVEKMGNQQDAKRKLFDLNVVGDIEITRSRTILRNSGDDHVSWYEISTILFDESRMNYAIDVTAVVHAEIAQRNFVQTLTKTFAHLSIGLAIFDRNRQLALFNPALIGLTSLPADFLSARPNLLSFFDKLRDNRMMPEPKNYSSWREQLASVIAAAADGLYSETWALESGQTYRVTGRPHPDGAIAFLFEDISAEISLAQGFRAQLELGQSVLDQETYAMAIFSSDGALTLSNAAYQELWDVDPDSSFATITISDTIQQWKRKCANLAEWDRLKDAVSRTDIEGCSYAEIELKSGAVFECRVSRLPRGYLSVKFSEASQAHPDKMSLLTT